jgi:hypothetical protein
MFILSDTSDYLGVLAIAAGCGLIGGFVYELLQTRRRGTGRIELPGRVGRSLYFDLGFVASIIVGGVAAVAVLYVFPPRLDLAVTASDGTTTVTGQYDLIKLIAISLIAGSAGASILAALQGRVLNAVNAQQVINTQAQAKTALKSMADRAVAEAKGSIAEALAEAPPEPFGAGVAAEPPSAGPQGAGLQEATDRISANLQARLDQHAQELGQLIESGAQPVLDDKTE